MSEIKSVAREGFNTVEAARADAAGFVKIGGKVIEGGARDSGFGWTGEIVVDDTQIHVAGTFHCGRCAGTGAFITYVENGVPKGPGGICFRCQGKSRHTQEDRKRNRYHDIHSFGRWS